MSKYNLKYKPVRILALMCCVLFLGLSSKGQTNYELLSVAMDQKDFDQGKALIQNYDTQTLENWTEYDQLRTWAFILGDYDRALKFSELALTKFAKSEMTRDGDFIHLSFSLIAANKHNSNHIVAYKVALKLEDDTEALYGQKSVMHAYSLALSGELLLELGKLQMAEANLMTAYRIVENAPNSLYKGHVLALYSKYLIEWGAYSAAENYLRQAFFIYNSQEEVTNNQKLDSYFSLAKLYIQLNNYPQALQSIQTVEELLSKNLISTHPLQNRILQLKSEIMFNSGNNKAIPELLRAKTLNEKHNNIPLEWVRLYSFASITDDQDENINDLMITGSPLKVLQNYYGENHYKLIEIKRLEARHYYLKRDYEKTISLLKEAERSIKNTLNYEHPLYLKVMSDLAVSYWSKGEIKSAKNIFSESISLYKIQYQRQFAFLSEGEKEQFYNGIKMFLNKYYNFVQENHLLYPDLLAELLNTRLLFKGLLFNSTRSLKEQVLRSPKLFKKYQEYVASSEHLAAAHKIIQYGNSLGVNLDSLDNATNLLEKEISLRVNIGESKSDQQRLILTWEDLKNDLEKGEGAVEVITFPKYDPISDQIDEENYHYAYLYINKKTRKRPEVLFLEGNELNNKAYTFYRNSIKFKVVDTRSYNVYWQPIKDHFNWENLNKLYFSPDGVYNLLSIQSLYNSSKEKYVVEELEDVIICGNLSDFVFEKRNFKDQESEALLIGYPDYYSMDIAQAENGKEIPLLPGTREEVNEISNVLDESGVEFEKKMSNNASEGYIKETANKSASPRILHIATHGFFMEPEKDGVNPMALSGIMLAGAAYADTHYVLSRQNSSLSEGKRFDDGVLFANEAMNLNLHTTELVVLSACETGLGVVKSGEGVYGLQRAFQTAGANSVVMSLWQVDDEATRLFMTKFYSEWFEKGNKRKAFLAAQLSLKDKYDFPYYWGAFVLIGQ